VDGAGHDAVRAPRRRSCRGGPVRPRLRTSMARAVDGRLLGPMADASAFTAIMLAAAIPWGFFRHWWVLTKFAITLVQLYLGIFLLSPTLAHSASTGPSLAQVVGTALMASAIAFQGWLVICGKAVGHDSRSLPRRRGNRTAVGLRRRGPGWPRRPDARPHPRPPAAVAVADPARRRPAAPAVMGRYPPAEAGSGVTSHGRYDRRTCAGELAVGVPATTTDPDEPIPWPTATLTMPLAITFADPHDPPQVRSGPCPIGPR
jgi:hypothetical protein